MRRFHAGLAAAAATALVAAVLGACGGDTPAGGSKSAPTYADAPGVAWHVAAADIPGAGDAPILTDPRAPRGSGEGLAAPHLFDLGSVLVASVVASTPEGFGPSRLVGLTTQTGEVAWTYRPEEAGELLQCAEDLVDGRLGCLAAAPGEGDPATLRFVDVATGREEGRIDLPGLATSLAVVNGRAVVVLNESGTFRVAAYTADGAPAWSTDLPPNPAPPEDPAGWWLAGSASSGLLAVSAGDATVLLDERGRLLGDVRRGSPIALPAAVLLDAWSDATSGLTLLDGRGRDVASFPDHEYLTPLGSGAGGEVLLRGPTGDVVVLEPDTGVTHATGVVLGSTFAAHSVSMVGETILVGDGSAIYAHTVDQPGKVRWAVEYTGGPAPTSGTLLYTLSGAACSAVLTATALDDGAPRWVTTIALPSTGFAEESGCFPALEVLTDRLVIADTSSLVALEPAGGAAGGPAGEGDAAASAPTAAPGQTAPAPTAAPGAVEVVAWGEDGQGQARVPRPVEPASRLSAGGYHTVALREDGTVLAWGWNASGQASVPGGLGDVVEVSGGGHHTLALTSSGEVRAWGFTGYDATPVPDLPPVAAVSAGGEHSVALTAGGEVVAWGDNRYGQVDVPEGLTGVVAIEAGHFHNLALRSDGTVAAWGFNGSNRATVPDGLTDVVAVSAGRYHNLALRSDGTVVAWGNDRGGRASVPAGLAGVVAISAGGSHSLALRADGTVVAWGADGYGEASVPPGLDDVVAISAGAYHSTALREDGTVVAWGRDLESQVSLPDPLTGVVAVAAGREHNLALRADGTVQAWGAGGFGLTDVPRGLADVVSVAAGTAHSLALRADGTVVAWGGSAAADMPLRLAGVVAVAAGEYHSLALLEGGTVVAWGSVGGSETMVPEGLTGVVAVAAGAEHSLALRGDGTVVAWGSNRSGQCSVPPDLTDVVAVSAGDAFSVALRRDGTVVAWGANYAGQTTVPAGLTGVTAVDAGGQHTLALTGDGSLVAWGSGVQGQADVPEGLTGVVAFSAGGAHSLAVTRPASS